MQGFLFLFILIFVLNLVFDKDVLTFRAMKSCLSTKQAQHEQQYVHFPTA